MPRAADRAATAARREAIRADRARGLTFTEIGRRHGICAPLAHRYARDVDVVLVWRPWHLARWCKPEPAPMLWLPAALACRVTPWAS